MLLRLNCWCLLGPHAFYIFRSFVIIMISFVSILSGLAGVFILFFLRTNIHRILHYSPDDKMLPSRDEANRLLRSLHNCNIRLFQGRGHTLLLVHDIKRHVYLCVSSYLQNCSCSTEFKLNQMMVNQSVLSTVLPSVFTFYILLPLFSYSCHAFMA